MVASKNKKSDDKKDAPLKKVTKRKPRIERILKKKGPQLIEHTKNVLIVKGNHTSQEIKDVLKDLALLSKPNCKVLQRNNQIFPFEDITSIEFLTGKNDCSLFAMGSHSKKRPQNLTLGRTYDGSILDMVEFGVDSYNSLHELTGSSKGVGSKPLFCFVGDQWESDTSYQKIQNLLLDFFRGDKVDKISLKGLDHVIVVTVVDSKIYFRIYNVGFSKSGTRIPNVELDPMGPFMDLAVRRVQFAQDDLWNVACKKPKKLEVTKVKNVSKTSKGDKVGRIHMEKQNLDAMGGRRSKLLRGDRKAASS